MKAFADLFLRLDATTSSNDKRALLREYLAQAEPADAAWAIYFLAGGKPRQLVPVKILRQLLLEQTRLPEWLLGECYQAVGDLAEMLSLLLPEGEPDAREGLAEWMERDLLPLRGLAPDIVLPRLRAMLHRLDQPGRMVLLKIITSSFRIGVSKLLVTRALADLAGVDPTLIAQRLVGYTDLGARPTAQQYLQLIDTNTESAPARRDGRPYPFFLAHPLLSIPDEANLGPVPDYLVEWKWDGIRAQLVKRADAVWIWSRGEDLVTERFPELAQLGALLPDGTVIDGEIVVWKHHRVQAFALLQQRIGRKNLTAKLLQEAPVALLAYDLLEADGEDLREHALVDRRARLEPLVAALEQPALRLSPLVAAADWETLARERDNARALGVEGLMLKEKNARYGVGRTKRSGIWWKWKIDPYSVDAVLIYAERGHGRRANLYTDYTFGVWDGELGDPQRTLVPFAKAYSGLTDEEIREVDAIIRNTTTEKFGPVRSVVPQLVFELGFEGIAASRRHKSGVAVRFPRMLRWRRDKPVEEADTLNNLHALLAEPAP